MHNAEVKLGWGDANKMNKNIFFSDKFSKLVLVAMFAQILALAAASPSAADINSPAKKTEAGYIYFPGTPFEQDKVFHIEALSHDVEAIADSESPVGIERAIVFTPLELWIERYSGATITYLEKLAVDIPEVERMFSQCAWKIGGSLVSDGPVTIISIVPKIKDKPFDVIKYNVMYKDDFGEVSFIGTQASFSSEAAPHIFEMATEFGSSYKVRGKFYIFIRQVVFSDGSTWEADYKKIIGGFYFPVRSETPIESMIKNIIPEEKRVVVSEEDRPMVNFNSGQLKINEGCDPWFQRKEIE